MIRKMACLVALLTVFFAVVPAWANTTDYRCLNLCVNGGKSPYACRQQCTLIDGALKQQEEAGLSHKLFDAPQVSNTVVLPNAKHATPPPKDYQCINQCLQQRMNYDLCNITCAKPRCSVGSINCKKAGEVSTGTYSNSVTK